MEKGIVVAGSLILDRHYAVNTFPEEGWLVQINDTTEDVGGIGNIILDFAKIDKNLKIQVNAIIGKDNVGQSIMRQLSQYPNIITDGIVFQGKTPLTLVIDAQDTMQRTFFICQQLVTISVKKILNGTSSTPIFFNWNIFYR